MGDAWHLGLRPTGAGASSRGVAKTTIHHDHKELLRRLAINDEAAVESMLAAATDDDASDLDPKTNALVRLAGVVAMASSPSSFQWAMTRAAAAGASEAEIVGVLVTLAPIVGVVGVTRSAPEFSLALGFELDQPEAGDP